MLPKDTEEIANNVDPDQIATLGLPRPVCMKT